MTGTLTILGRGKTLHEWDTADEESMAKARQLFAEATGSGGQAFDTSGGEGKPMPPESFAPGTEGAPEDVTIVPPFGGGA